MLFRALIPSADTLTLRQPEWVAVKTEQIVGALSGQLPL